MDSAKKPQQRVRLGVCFLYAGFLILANRLVLGEWLPYPSADGMWFYSGLVMLLLYSFLVEPYFTRPADAIANAATAEIALLSVYAHARSSGEPAALLATQIGLYYAVLVLVSSVTTILLKDAKQKYLNAIKTFTWELATQFGSARVVFSAVFIVSMFSFPHLQSWRGAVILALWWLIASVQPLETLVRGIAKAWYDLRPGDTTPLGVLRDIVTPGHARVWLEHSLAAAEPRLVALEGEEGEAELGLLIGTADTVDQSWGRVIRLGVKGPAKALGFSRRIAMGDERRVVSIRENELPEDLRARLDQQTTYSQRAQLVGFVSTGTDVRTLRFEVVSTDHDLQETGLVIVDIRGEPVFYQLTNGLTKEEIVVQTSERGFIIAEAEKVGMWDDAKRAFHPTPWLPDPYTSVFMHDVETATKEEREELLRCSVGVIPGTKYPAIVDLQKIVTHNTAILGILGVGKSTLARELVHRILGERIKVLCIDPTGEYVRFLGTVESQKPVDSLVSCTEEECKKKQDNVNQSPHLGGSLPEFRRLVNLWIPRFVNGSFKTDIVVINPLEFTVTRQDQKPYQGKAAMVELTSVEITRIITEACLDAVRDDLSPTARLCIVYEEAHSLVPEFGSIAAEGDQTAAMGTARAILQGRKYGLGCILITQRTANVTKSILNQCNTVFAMRIFDSTGVDFLKNYIGPKYAQVLSSLAEYHAVVFGRGSLSPQPLIVQLNHPEDFKKAFYEAEEAVTTEQEQLAPEALE